jgi:ribosomal protein S18 acetylase RimI-like enzyme
MDLDREEIEIEIEQASLEDAETILRLQMQAYCSEAEIYNDYSIPPLIQSFNEIKQEFLQQVFLKAIQKDKDKDKGKEVEDDARIIGAVRAYLEKGTTYIGRLIVIPEYQNRGLGTRLMYAIEEHFKLANRYELFTGDKSARNLHLYKKLGYHEFKRIRVNDQITMVYLEKFKNNYTYEKDEKAGLS